MASCVAGEHGASRLVANGDALVGLNAWLGLAELVERTTTNHVFTELGFDERTDERACIASGDVEELHLGGHVDELLASVFNADVGGVGVELGGAAHAGAALSEVLGEGFSVRLGRDLNTLGGRLPLEHVDARNHQTQALELTNAALSRHAEDEGPAIGGDQLAHAARQARSLVASFGLLTIGRDHHEERHVRIVGVWDARHDVDQLEHRFDHRRAAGVRLVRRQWLQNLNVGVDHLTTDDGARTDADGDGRNDGVLIVGGCGSLDDFQLFVVVTQSCVSDGAH